MATKHGEEEVSGTVAAVGEVFYCVVNSGR